MTDILMVDHAKRVGRCSLQLADSVRPRGEDEQMSAIDDIVAPIGKATDDLDTVISGVGSAIDETENAINTAEALGAEAMVAALGQVKDNLESWQQMLQGAKDKGDECRDGANASGGG